MGMTANAGRPQVCQRQKKAINWGVGPYADENVQNALKVSLCEFLIVKSRRRVGCAKIS